jgi:hypothetical protein
MDYRFSLTPRLLLLAGSSLLMLLVLFFLLGVQLGRQWVTSQAPREAAVRPAAAAVSASGPDRADRPQVRPEGRP